VQSCIRATIGVPIPAKTIEVPASRLGRRERKKLATRQALNEAALALVLERGFDEVTVEAISASADVSTRTFFNYFSSKEEAVLGEAPDPAAVRQAVLERPATETQLEATCNVLGGLALEVSAAERSCYFVSSSSTGIRPCSPST
jgi:AcrR family transcriptional regulator